MPVRAVGLLLSVAGLALVLALLLGRRDPYRCALVGPRWRRHLLVAGLAALTALGVGSFGAEAHAGPPVNGGEMEDQAEWKRLLATLNESDEVGSGKRGAYPFEANGKERLLERLADAEKDVAALESDGRISAAEGGLLRKDLARSKEGVEARRPTEARRATCYKPMTLDAADASLARLRERLPLLEKLAATERLRPEVVAKVLVAIESDVEELAREESLARLEQKERKDAKRVRDAVKLKLTQIRARSSK